MGTTALIVLALFMGLLGLLGGFLLCGILVIGRKADLEHTLSVFANANNWRIDVVKGNVVRVWNDSRNPV